MKDKNNHINYIELYTNDLIATKTFYQNVFNWEFTDYGQNYASFNGAGLDGGFELTSEPIRNGALVVIYHKDLDVIKAKIVKHGGQIKVDTFTFPGGQRFQFLDPTGNELAVWSKMEND